MENTGNGKDGGHVGPRSRTLAKEGLLFQGNNSHTHPLQVGRLTQDVMSSGEWGAATPGSHAAVNKHQLSQSGTGGSVRLPGS